METEHEHSEKLLWMLREELETAWLRGYAVGRQGSLGEESVREMAAIYAERVVGGPARPQRPEAD